MRFLVDMPLSPVLAGWLRSRGHDAVHALDAGLGSASDETILERAQSEHRVVVTADLDYPRLLALTEAAGPGLILFRGGNYSENESAERLQRVLEAIAERDLPSSVVIIEKSRIRRRWLPLRLGP